MRFISKWSYAGAKNLAGILNEDHKKRFEYYFALQLILGESVKTVILFSISLILGIFVPTLLITATFVLLRMIAGGYHMDTQGKCLYVTLAIFITSPLIVKYTYQYWNFNSVTLLIIITFLLGLYTLGKYAPKDTPNKPITSVKKIRKLKLVSLVYLFIWLIITVLLNIFQFRLAAICLCFGVLLELFIISPIGHRFFDLFNYGFNNKLKI